MVTDTNTGMMTLLAVRALCTFIIPRLIEELLYSLKVIISVLAFLTLHFPNEIICKLETSIPVMETSASFSAQSD